MKFLKHLQCWNRSLVSILLSVWMISEIGAQNAPIHSIGGNTNSFFDNDTVFQLKVNDIYVDGEVFNPGKADLSNLPQYPVIVKETLIDSNGVPSFIGAYKYEGYALSDILDLYKLNKANADAFPPLIDLYVEIYNDLGERVVFSWGELYYPNKFFNIILATSVMRIVPEKTGERWPLPVDCKIIVASDLLTTRNITRPTRIVVRSCTKDIFTVKGKFPLESEYVRVFDEGRIEDTLFSLPENGDPLTLHTVFYGKGRGLHSTKPFTGCNLKDILSHHVDFTTRNLSNGLILFVADDGYRAIFTLSELCNRNDQEYSILLFNPDDQGVGRFRLFPSCDFFSDRAVRGLSEIWFSCNPM
jgi:hypothetical protein